MICILHLEPKIDKPKYLGSESEILELAKRRNKN